LSAEERLAVLIVSDATSPESAPTGSIKHSIQVVMNLLRQLEHIARQLANQSKPHMGTSIERYLM
jgi:hypothetical protein